MQASAERVSNGEWVSRIIGVIVVAVLLMALAAIVFAGAAPATHAPRCGDECHAQIDGFDPAEDS